MRHRNTSELAVYQDQPPQRPVPSWGDAEPPSETSPNWGDFSSGLPGLFTMLRKRMRIVLASFLVVTGAAVFYCISTDPLYRAKVMLEIRGYEPLLEQGQSEEWLGKDTRRLEYPKTIIAKLTAYSIADEVLSRSDLAREVNLYLKNRQAKWRTWISRYIRKAHRYLARLGWLPPPDSAVEERDEVTGPFRHAEPLLRSYLGLLSTTPVRETSLVQLDVETSSPRMSQKIANMHAEVFIEQLRRERQQELQERLNALEKHSRELQHRLAETEESAAIYARDHQILALPHGQRDEVSQKNVTDVNELLAHATAKRIRSESLIKEVQKVGEENAAVLDDPGIRDLVVQRETAQAQYASLIGKVTPLYPPLQEVRARIGSLSESIRQQRKQRYSALQSEYQTDLSAESRLVDQVERERSSANELSKKLVRYNLLVREANSLRGLTDLVNQQYKETQIAAESSRSNIYVVDSAARPGRPYWPKVNVLLILGAAVGTALGCGLALLREAFDSKIGSTEDAQHSLGLAALGSIPSFRAPRAQDNGPRRFLLFRKKVQPAQKPRVLIDPAAPDEGAGVPARLITLCAPQASVSEALRTIRTGLLFSSAGEPARVILVSSCMKGEGKTTVAANLAVSMAQASYSTLLIDADLRHPAASSYFGVTRCSPGLVNFLTGNSTLEECLFTTAVENLSVMPSGAITPSPAELVGSGKMREMLGTLAQRYDYVIVDSPPLIPIADGLMLSRAVDGVVFVVRSLKTDRPAAQEAVRRLRRVGARVLGVVINDVKRSPNMYSVDKYIFNDKDCIVVESAA